MVAVVTFGSRVSLINGWLRENLIAGSKYVFIAQICRPPIGPTFHLPLLTARIIIRPEL